MKSDSGSSDSDFFEAEMGAENLPEASYPMTSQPRLPHDMPYEATVSPKHFTAVILSVLLGSLGIDRMYMGRAGLGTAKLLAIAAQWAIFFLIWDFSDYDSISAWGLIPGLFLLPTSWPELLALPTTIWFTIDTVLIGLGKARDGDGNPLISYMANDTNLLVTRKGRRPYQALISKKHQAAVIFGAIPITAMLGIDRFYTGRIALGILKILTIGGLGIWVLVDVILIANGRARDKDGIPLIAPKNRLAPAFQPTPISERSTDGYS